MVSIISNKTLNQLTYNTLISTGLTGFNADSNSNLRLAIERGTIHGNEYRSVGLTCNFSVLTPGATSKLIGLHSNTFIYLPNPTCAVLYGRVWFRDPLFYVCGDNAKIPENELDKPVRSIYVPKEYNLVLHGLPEFRGEQFFVNGSVSCLGECEGKNFGEVRCE